MEKGVIRFKGGARNLPCPCGSGEKFKKCCLRPNGTVSRTLERKILNHKNMRQMFSYLYEPERTNIFSLNKLLKYAKNMNIFLKAHSIKDKRSDPIIKPFEIFIYLFLTFILKISSLNSAEGYFRNFTNFRNMCFEDPAFYDIVYILRTSKTTVRRSLLSMFIEDLRDILYLTWTNLLSRIGITRFEAVCFDGVELTKSRNRKCKLCHQRKNHRGELIEYYHKIVYCYVIYGSTKVILDLEIVKPGEGETTAAKRLYRRIYDIHKGRFANICVFDGLYTAEFIKEILNVEKGEVNKTKIIIKTCEENLEIIQDAEHFYKFLKEPIENGYDLERGCKYKIWDTDADMEWRKIKNLRVVKVEEEYDEKEAKHRKCRKKKFNDREVFWCITTIPLTEEDCQMIREYAHHRWAIENNCFREKKSFWHADHVFIHDENAFETMLFILSISYNIFHMWVDDKFAEWPQIAKKPNITFEEITYCLNAFFVRRTKLFIQKLQNIIQALPNQSKTHQKLPEAHLQVIWDSS